MPDSLRMVEVSKIAPPSQLAQIRKIAQPNDMIALYMPISYLGAMEKGLMKELPKDLVIIAVPKGNPSVPGDQFHLLKDALRPKLKQSEAVIFEDNPLWLGATRPYVEPRSQKTYLFSTAVVSVKDRALMVQYLKQATKNSDIDFVHNTVRTIVDHVSSINGISAQPQPQLSAPAKTTQPSYDSYAPVTPSVKPYSSHNSNPSKGPSLYNRRP